MMRVGTGSVSNQIVSKWYTTDNIAMMNIELCESIEWNYDKNRNMSLLIMKFDEKL